MKAHSSLPEDEEWSFSTSALNQALTTSGPSEISRDCTAAALGLPPPAPPPLPHSFALGTGAIRDCFTFEISVLGQKKKKEKEKL